MYRLLPLAICLIAEVIAEDELQTGEDYHPFDSEEAVDVGTDIQVTITPMHTSVMESPHARCPQ